MRLPTFVTRWLFERYIPLALVRKPDFVIPGDGGDYLRRWFITPWSKYERGSKPANLWQAFKRKLPNIYFHNFRRSDDDRALHDHPWWNVSILLVGNYVEHTIPQGGVHVAKTYASGDMKFRGARSAHRIEIDTPCWTLFITGPSIREWGFHCPQGWRHWRDFVDSRDSGKVGRGCA